MSDESRAIPGEDDDNRSLRNLNPKKTPKENNDDRVAKGAVLLPEQIFPQWNYINDTVRSEFIKKLEGDDINYEDFAPREKFNQFIQDIFEHEVDLTLPLNPTERTKLFDFLYREFYGLGGLEPYLDHPKTEDITLNKFDSMYVYVGGVSTFVDNSPFKDDKSVTDFLTRILAAQGRTINRANPIENGTLPDGSRLIAMVPPVVKHPSFVIRKHNISSYSEEDYVKMEMFPIEFLHDLKEWVKLNQTIVLSGSTGSGKTTFLNFISNLINPIDRICVIEDTSEIEIQVDNVLYFQSTAAGARKSAKDDKGISIRDLVAAALRVRPDKLLVGECRSGEAFDMLQAVNTGHAGSMTTLHANNPNDAIKRLESMAMQTDDNLPVEAIQDLIGSGVDIIIQVERYSGEAKRVVKSAYQVFHPLSVNIDELPTGRDGVQKIRESVYTMPLWRWDYQTKKLIKVNDLVMPEH